jgi:uncharacterized protein (DUF433 family)
VVMSQYITSSPDVMNGTHVFRGTRVPVATLFDYLVDGYSVDQILAEFPALVREDVFGLLDELRQATLKSAA